METYYEFDSACCCEPVVAKTFWTNEEKLQLLKEYKEDLDQESQAITQKISDMEKER